MIFWLLLFAVITTALLILDRILDDPDDQVPSYERSWARAFADTPPQRSHVTIAHRPCRFCHQQGEHDAGCSRLDRLDAGEGQP